MATRTPGSLGYNDAASPDSPFWFLGDTPGSLGFNDHAAPELVAENQRSPNENAKDSGGRQPASKLSLGSEGLALLMQIETLRLKPYDDQTGKEISVWTKGATIGYGHLIKENEWITYKGGITEPDANTLFKRDLSPFEAAVRTKITAGLKQNEFDALVILAFNIGAGENGFAGSSVVKIVNDPNAKTAYKNLELAWKAWNKSQGEVNKGLENRRLCEWKIYSEGTYKKW